MSEHMRKHPTENHDGSIRMHHAGVIYQFPIKVAEKYRLSDQKIKAIDVFASVNKKYTKPGALLRGIRIREDLTQAEMAKKLKVTQSDISQIENGVRVIGRTIAKRIEELFDVSYRSFLE